MNGSKSGGFSMGWVVVTYFMMCGGLTLTMVAFGLAKLEGAWVPYAAFGIGAFIGGFFAGRASPHHSVVEAAVGGVLMVLTMIGFFAATPLGPLLYSVAKNEAIRQALIYAGISMVGGLGGAVVGEKSSSGPPSQSGARWLGLSTLINFGAMFIAMVVFAVLLIREAKAVSEGETPSIDADTAVTAVFVALAAAAFMGGLVTQAAAPRRMLLAAGLGAFVALGSVFLYSISAAAATTGGSNKAMGEAFTGAAIVAVGAGIVGILGAAVGWALVRGRKTA